MKTKALLLLWIIVAAINTVSAQNEIQINDIDCYNLGDGRLFCKLEKDEKPVEGKVKIIDGYQSQYAEVEFKGGIPNGSWKDYKNNVLIGEKYYIDGIIDGDRKEYYSDGKIKSIIHFTKGKADGKQIEYSFNGKIKSEKGFKDGFEDGVDVTYDENGNIRSKTVYVKGKIEGKSVRNYDDSTIDANYKNGRYDGDYSETFTNGNIKTKGKYVDGKKDGTWEYGKKDGKKTSTDVYSQGDKIKETLYYTDGKVEVVRELKNGKKNGYERKYNYSDASMKSELYYIDGELASAPSPGKTTSVKDPGANAKTSGMIKQTRQISTSDPYTITFYQVNNKYEGDYTEQYVNGGAMKESGQYSNGLKQGLWIYNTPDGKKTKEENYLDGKFNGLLTKYNNGIINESQMYKNDVRNGEFKSYNIDGKLILKGNYENDKRQGLVEEYYPSGKIKAKYTYKNGGKDGVEQEFYINGKMKSEISYSEGSYFGPFKYWNENGQLQSEGEYASGNRIKTKTTYENGKLYFKEYTDEDGQKKVDYYDENGKKKN